MTGLNTDNVRLALKAYGLSENQIEIYMLLCLSGDKRIADIANMTVIPRSSIYENLKGLMEMGLVEEVMTGSSKRLKAYPFSAISHNLNENIARMQQLAKEAPHIESLLQSIPSPAGLQATEVRYYQGISGARQIFWNSLKTKDILYIYSEWGRSKYLGVKFYENFVEESYKRGFKENVLTNPKPRVLESIKAGHRQPTSRTDPEKIRLIDTANIEFKGDTLMYDNIYAQVFLKDRIIDGFEIENQAFVRTQRAIFETLWQTATPLSELL